MYPHTPIVPTKDLDKVWHAHILDTVKYEADCNEIFGTFLHHFPYFGLRDDDDAKNLQAAFANTRSLFQEHFSFDPAKPVAADCGGGSCQCGCNGTSCGGCADDISFKLASCDSSQCQCTGGLTTGYKDGKMRPRLDRSSQLQTA
jgi:hypothetical protein